MTPIVLLVGKGRSGKDTAAAVLCEELKGQAVALADPIKRFFMKCCLTPGQLWGAEKETEFETPHIAAEMCCFWLSQAVTGWKTPSQLSGLGFESWIRGLPKRTTPRYLMQTFGTECIRGAWPDFWVDYGLHVSFELLSRRAVYSRELGLVRCDPRDPPPQSNNVVVITDGRFPNEILKLSMAGATVVRLMRQAQETGLSAEAKRHSGETDQDGVPAWWYDNTIFNVGTLEQFQAEVVELAGGIVTMGITQLAGGQLLTAL